ncbi:hypothetical protein J8273_8174 [Carpediemonas membranifera]|uniref:Uncharacterized protein n=1 Tax=Carpediemonas membranifera TaxID=201153 RepID=A0A8J6APM7_9EUKA|nr:hypothetical protein J8273_8174 [Carpediemonas membranifera]|eukprot:KAG9390136.1 hypothetical protein J8273_8174 [Carpediemonas membranifera]
MSELEETWRRKMKLLDDPEPAARSFACLLIRSLMPSFGKLITVCRQNNSNLPTEIMQKVVDRLSQDPVVENRVDLIEIAGSFTEYVGTQSAETKYLDHAFVTIMCRLVDVHVAFKQAPAGSRTASLQMERIMLIVSLYKYLLTETLPVMARHTLHMLLFLTQDVLSSLPLDDFFNRVSMIDAINSNVPQRRSLRLLIGNLFTPEVRRLLAALPPDAEHLKQPLLLFLVRWPTHNQHEAYSVSFLLEGARQLSALAPAFFRESPQFKSTLKQLEAEIDFRKRFNLIMRVRQLILVPGTFCQLSPARVASEDIPPSLSRLSSERRSISRMSSVTSVDDSSSKGAPFFSSFNTFPHTSGLWMFLPPGTPTSYFTLRKPHQNLPGVPEGFITHAAVHARHHVPASCPMAPDVPQTFTFFVGRPTPVIPDGASHECPPVPALASVTRLKRAPKRLVPSSPRRKSVIGVRSHLTYSLGLLSHPTFHYEKDLTARKSKKAVVHCSMRSSMRTNPPSAPNVVVRHTEDVPEGYLRTPLLPGQAAVLPGIGAMRQYTEAQLDFPLHQPLLLELHDAATGTDNDDDQTQTNTREGSMVSTAVTFASSMTSSLSSVQFVAGEASNSSRLPVTRRFQLRVVDVEAMDPSSTHDAETVSMCIGMERSSRDADLTSWGAQASEGADVADSLDLLPSQTFKMIVRHRFTGQWYRVQVSVERVDLPDDVGPMIEASTRWAQRHKAQAYEPPAPMSVGVDPDGTQLYLPLFNTMPAPAGFSKAGDDFIPYYTLPAPPRPPPAGVLMDGALFWSDAQDDADSSDAVLGGVTAAGMPYFYSSTSSVPVPAGYTPFGVPYYSITGLLDFLRGGRRKGIDMTNNAGPAVDFIEPLAVALVRAVDGNPNPNVMPHDVSVSSISAAHRALEEFKGTPLIIEEGDEDAVLRPSLSMLSLDQQLESVREQEYGGPVRSAKGISRSRRATRDGRGGSRTNIASRSAMTTSNTDLRSEFITESEMTDSPRTDTELEAVTEFDTSEGLSDSESLGSLTEAELQVVPETQRTADALAAAYLTVDIPREFPGHATLELSQSTMDFVSTGTVQEKTIEVSWRLPDETLLPDREGEDEDDSTDASAERTVAFEPVTLYVIAENRIFATVPSQLTIDRPEGTTTVKVRFNPLMGNTRSTDVLSSLLVHDYGGRHLARCGLNGFIGPSLSHSNPNLRELWALPDMERAVDVAVYNITTNDLVVRVDVEDLTVSGVDKKESVAVDAAEILTLSIDTEFPLKAHDEHKFALRFQPPNRGLYEATLVIYGPGDEQHRIPIEALAADPLRAKARKSRDASFNEQSLFDLGQASSMLSVFMDGVVEDDLTPQTEEELFEPLPSVLGRSLSAISLGESGTSDDDTSRAGSAMSSYNVTSSISFENEPTGVVELSTSSSSEDESDSTTESSSEEEGEEAVKPALVLPRPDSGPEPPQTPASLTPSPRFPTPRSAVSSRGSALRQTLLSRGESDISEYETETEESESGESQSSESPRPKPRRLEEGFVVPEKAPSQLANSNSIPAIPLEFDLMDRHAAEWGATPVTARSPRIRQADEEAEAARLASREERRTETGETAVAVTPPRSRASRQRPKRRKSLRKMVTEWESQARLNAGVSDSATAETQRVDLDYGFVPTGQTKSRGIELKNLSGGVLHSVLRLQTPLFKAPDTAAVPPRKTVSVPVMMTGQGDWSARLPNITMPPNIPVGEVDHDLHLFSTQCGPRKVCLNGFIGQGLFFSCASTMAFEPVSVGGTAQLTLPLVNMSRYSLTVTLKPLGKPGSLTAACFAADLTTKIAKPARLPPYSVTPVQFTYTAQTIAPATAMVVLQIHKPFRMHIPGTYAGSLTLLGSTLQAGPHNILGALHSAMSDNIQFNQAIKQLPKAVLRARPAFVESKVVLEPVQIHLPVVTHGLPAASVPVTVTNTGDDPITVALMATPPFTVAEHDGLFSLDLAAGETHKLHISMGDHPLALGPHNEVHVIEGIVSGYVAAAIMRGDAIEHAAVSVISATPPAIPPILFTPSDRVILMPDAALGSMSGARCSLRNPLFESVNVVIELEQSERMFALAGIGNQVTLAPFSVRVFAVQFVPTVFGDFTGILRIKAMSTKTDALLYAMEVALRGSSAVPVPEGLPESIDFGQVEVNSSYIRAIEANPGLDTTILTIISDSAMFQPLKDQVDVCTDRPTALGARFNASSSGSYEGLLQMCTTVDARIVPVRGAAGHLLLGAAVRPEVVDGTVDLGMCRVGMSYVVDVVLINRGTVDVTFEGVHSNDDGCIRLLYAGTPLKQPAAKFSSSRRGWVLLRRNLRIAAKNMAAANGMANPLYDRDDPETLFAGDVMQDDMSGVAHFVGQSTFVEMVREANPETLPAVLADRKQIGRLPTLLSGTMQHYKILFIPRRQGDCQYRIRFVHDTITPVKEIPLPALNKRIVWPRAEDVPAERGNSFTLDIKADVTDRLFVSPMIVSFGVVAARTAFGPKDSKGYMAVGNKVFDALDRFFADPKPGWNPPNLPVAFRTFTVFNKSIKPQRVTFKTLPTQFTVPREFTINPSTLIGPRSALQVPVAFQPTSSHRLVSEKMTLSGPIGETDVSLDGTGGAARIQLLSAAALDFRTIQLGLSDAGQVRLSNNGLLSSPVTVEVVTFLPHRRSKHRPGTRVATAAAPHPLCRIGIESYVVTDAVESKSPVECDISHLEVTLRPSEMLTMSVITATIAVSRATFDSYCPPNSRLTAINGEVRATWSSVDGGEAHTIAIPIRLTVGMAHVVVEPSSLSFGRVMSGVHVDKTLTLINRGSCAAEVSLTADQRDMVIVPDKAVVEAGASVPFSVNLVPSSGASLNSRIKIAVPPSTTLTVPCTAEVTVPQLVVNVDDFKSDFGVCIAGSETTALLRIRNIGNSTVAWRADIKGWDADTDEFDTYQRTFLDAPRHELPGDPPANPFTLQPAAGTINPQSTATMTVTARPMLPRVRYAMEFVVSAPGSLERYQLTATVVGGHVDLLVKCTAMPTGQLSMREGEFDFGALERQEDTPRFYKRRPTHTIRNIGNMPTTLQLAMGPVFRTLGQAHELAAPSPITVEPAEASIEPGEMVSVNVQLKPIHVGRISGEIRLDTRHRATYTALPVTAFIGEPGVTVPPTIDIGPCHPRAVTHTDVLVKPAGTIESRAVIVTAEQHEWLQALVAPTSRFFFTSGTVSVIHWPPNPPTPPCEAARQVFVELPVPEGEAAELDAVPGSVQTCPLWSSDSPLQMGATTTTLPGNTEAPPVALDLAFKPPGDGLPFESTLFVVVGGTSLQTRLLRTVCASGSSHRLTVGREALEQMVEALTRAKFIPMRVTAEVVPIELSINDGPPSSLTEVAQTELSLGPALRGVHHHQSIILHNLSLIPVTVNLALTYPDSARALPRQSSKSLGLAVTMVGSPRAPSAPDPADQVIVFLDGQRAKLSHQGVTIPVDGSVTVPMRFLGRSAREYRVPLVVFDATCGLPLHRATVKGMSGDINLSADGPFNFGEVSLGSEVTRQVIITNTGNLPLKVEITSDPADILGRTPPALRLKQVYDVETKEIYGKQTLKIFATFTAGLVRELSGVINVQPTNIEAPAASIPLVVRAKPTPFSLVPDTADIDLGIMPPYDERTIELTLRSTVFQRMAWEAVLLPDLQDLTARVDHPAFRVEPSAGTVQSGSPTSMTVTYKAGEASISRQTLTLAITDQAGIQEPVTRTVTAEVDNPRIVVRSDIMRQVDDASYVFDFGAVPIGDELGREVLLENTGRKLPCYVAIAISGQGFSATARNNGGVVTPLSADPAANVMVVAAQSAVKLTVKFEAVDAARITGVVKIFSSPYASLAKVIKDGAARAADPHHDHDRYMTLSFLVTVASFSLDRSLLRMESFGLLSPGQRAVSKTLIVRNSSLLPTMANISVEGPQSPVFGVADVITISDRTANLPPNAEHPITVAVSIPWPVDGDGLPDGRLSSLVAWLSSFVPGSHVVEPFLVVLRVPGATYHVPVDFQVSMPKLVISREALDFGATKAGAPVTLPLKVSCTAPVRLPVTVVPGHQSVAASVDRTVVEPNATLAMTATFLSPVPFSLPSRFSPAGTAQLAFELCSDVLPKQVVAVRAQALADDARGQGSDLVVSHTSMAFGDVPCGIPNTLKLVVAAPSAPQVVRLGISCSAPFSTPSSISIPIGVFGNIPVSFVPTQPGTARTALTIRQLAPPSEATVEVLLSGCGMLLKVALSRKEVDIGRVPVGSEAFTSVVIRNTGNMRARLRAVQYPANPDLALQCSKDIELEPGAARDVVISTTFNVAKPASGVIVFVPVTGNERDSLREIIKSASSPTFPLKISGIGDEIHLKSSTALVVQSSGPPTFDQLDDPVTDPALALLSSAPTDHDPIDIDALLAHPGPFVANDDRIVAAVLARPPPTLDIHVPAPSNTGKAMRFRRQSRVTMKAPKGTVRREDVH